MTTTLTLRSPEDLLAAAPVLLGFVPTESAVMFTFDAVNPFHARVDLPHDTDGVSEWIETLLAPCVVHGVGRVLFVLYSHHPLPAQRVCRRLVRSFRAAGIEVIDVLRADGHRWFPLLRSRRSLPATGVPYDVSTHPFAAEAVLRGRVTHGSRAALEATVAPDPAAVARVAQAVGDCGEVQAAWLVTTVAAQVAARSVPDDRAAALLLTGLQDEETRAAAVGLLSRDTAEAHADFWGGLVRRAPVDLVAPAAALLGVAAWLCGDGALAWCAVDRCLSTDPDHQPAHELARALAEAVPPSTWEEVTALGDPA